MTKRRHQVGKKETRNTVWIYFFIKVPTKNPHFKCLAKLQTHFLDMVYFNKKYS